MSLLHLRSLCLTQVHKDFILYFLLVVLFIYLLIFPLFFISWMQITLQYCSGFCHTLRFYI